MPLKENSNNKSQVQNSVKNTEIKYIKNNEIFEQDLDESNKSETEEVKDKCYFRDQIEIKVLHFVKNKNKLSSKNNSYPNLEIMSLLILCSSLNCRSKKYLHLSNNIIEIEKKLDFNYYFKNMLDLHIMKQILFSKEQIHLLEFN